MKSERDSLPPHVLEKVEEAERREARTIVVPAHDGKPEFTYTGLPLPRAKGRVPTLHRSKLEDDYAEVLEARRLAGEILSWWYEPFTLHLGGQAGTKGGVKYRIDFLILPANRELEIHETKGFFRRGERERLKLAAAKFPFIVKAITRENGAWIEEAF